MSTGVSSVETIFKTFFYTGLDAVKLHGFVLVNLALTKNFHDNGKLFRRMESETERLLNHSFIVGSERSQGSKMHKLASLVKCFWRRGCRSTFQRLSTWVLGDAGRNFIYF